MAARFGGTSQAPTLRFLGGARTVTGSKFLLDAGEARVLVDCGLFQGAKPLRLRNWAPFPVDASSIDAIVLTHAHLDHVGYLPALVRKGFRGRVVCTVRTAELAAIVLADAGRLQEEEAAYANRKGYSKHVEARPLYTAEDAERACQRLRPTPFDAVVDVASGVQAVLRPAGHILGSATATITVAGRTLFFTGDVGRPTHPLLLPPMPLAAADLVVTESTYGNRRHDDAAESLERFADAIRRTADRGGTIVIPAFAVDRTEVVLLALGRLVADGRIPDLPIHADSPMGLAVLDVYRKAIAEGDVDVRSFTGDPFDVLAQVHEAATPDDSRRLDELRGPAIIVSSSGMATGGRVLHHLAHRLPDARNAVVLVGFQAEGTRGRLLADGARSVKMLGRYVPVRAEVVDIAGFSVHADADELVPWLATAPSAPDCAFVVHGEPAASFALADRLVDELAWHAVVPSLDERVRIDPV